MSEAQDRGLRQSYSEIIYGFSMRTKGAETIRVKHFSPLDNLEVDFLYGEYYNKAKAKGYPNEAERLEQLEKDRLWTSGDENNLAGVREYIKSLTLSKKKAFLKRDIDSINSQIQEQENLFKEMVLKRERLIGATVEKFTRKSVDGYLINKSFFKDVELKTHIYTQEEFDELEQEELIKLFSIYNEVMENLSEYNIKKIALSAFFQNAFSLCEKIYEFYGKPLCFLTNFQINLAAYGSYYKQILQSEAKPPDEFLSDPDKLEDWFTSKTNVEQMLDKNVKMDEGAVSIMGATKEDLKNWGYDQQGISLKEATKKAGGVLEKEDLMKLYGVN
jgi:hypothetical protein